MAYNRVIPRDLFNESGLLKCVGKLWIATERYSNVKWRHDGRAFDVRQDESDGSIYIDNVSFLINGALVTLNRPLNSRDSWALYANSQCDNECAAFNDDGTLSDEMRLLIETE